MYLDHFGLSEPPFKITPNTEFFYTGGNRGAILDALLYAIIHGEGIVKVTGEIGSGKTMLCRMLESMLPDNVEAVYLANPSLNRDEVFHAIADELGLATEGKRGGEIMRLMQNCLIEKHAASKQVVLLVEEAQAMPLDTLEEIRLLSNLETAHHKLLQIVLFGQPELDDHLNLPQMRQLKERITHGFKVPPLDQKDIPEYLMFRLRAAGYHGPNIFNAAAIKLIATASQGIIRRINVLADKALLAAFSENTHSIQPKHVKAAIEDSEFAIPPRSPPLKQIGFAAALIGLGIALGVGWQHLASLPLKAGAATPTVQTAPAPAVQPGSVRTYPRSSRASTDRRRRTGAAAKPPSGEPAHPRLCPIARARPATAKVSRHPVMARRRGRRPLHRSIDAADRYRHDLPMEKYFEQTGQGIRVDANLRLPHPYHGRSPIRHHFRQLLLAGTGPRRPRQAARRLSEQSAHTAHG